MECLKIIIAELLKKDKMVSIRDRNISQHVTLKRSQSQSAKMIFHEVCILQNEGHLFDLVFGTSKSANLYVEVGKCYKNNLVLWIV